MRYEILISPSANAESNMQRDAFLLQSLADNPRAVVHFYEWEKPSATYGYFIDPERYFDFNGIARHQLQLARRPTGGGILFHTCDLAFSVLIPSCHRGYNLNPMDNYSLINRAVLEAIGQFTAHQTLVQKLELCPHESPKSFLTDAFCMATPTRYDVMLDGRKVGGAAQRRVRHGFLHQGTIALGLPEEHFLKDVLLAKQSVADAMRHRSRALIGAGYTPEQLKEARRTLRALLVKSLQPIL